MKVHSLHSRCHPLPVRDNSRAGGMAPYQLPCLENPQPPAPAAVGIGTEISPASAQRVTKRTSSPRWPCPSLPEASAVNKPPGWRQAAAHAVGAGEAPAAFCSARTDAGVACKPIQEQPNAPSPLHFSSSATQNPSVALQSGHGPKCRRKVSLPVNSLPRSPSPLLPLPFLLAAGRAG